MVLVNACSGDNGQVPQAGLDAAHGGLVVPIRIADASPSTTTIPVAAPSNPSLCIDKGIGVMSIQILSSEGTPIAQGDFPCQNGEGTLTGIPSGSGYQVMVSGLAQYGGAALYRGSQSGIQVNPGQVATTPTVNVNPRITTLTLEVGSTSLFPGQTTFATLRTGNPEIDSNINLVGVPFFNVFNQVAGSAIVSAGGVITGGTSNSGTTATMRITAKYAGITSNEVVVSTAGQAVNRPIDFVVDPGPSSSGTALSVLAGESTVRSFKLELIVRTLVGTGQYSVTASCPTGLVCTFPSSFEGSPTNFIVVPNVSSGPSITPITLNVSAANNPTPGTHTITVLVQDTEIFGCEPIFGPCPTLLKRASIALGVDVLQPGGALFASDSFAMTSSTLINVTAGEARSTPVILTTSSGTPGPVTLSIEGCPSGITCNLTPTTLTPTQNGAVSMLSINVQDTVPASNVELKVNGTGGGLSRQASVLLGVSANASGISRVSVSSDGGQTNGALGTDPAISANGRYVAFVSPASNLVLGDNNGQSDVFVRDTCRGANACIPSTMRVSIATDGTQGNGFSSEPAISGDGRYVSFSSEASNLVAGDTNNGQDIFVRDTCLGVSSCTPTTTRVSVASDGTQSNIGSQRSEISANGRYVTFETSATNLAAGDTDDKLDVFSRDTCLGATGCTPSTILVSEGTAQDASDISMSENGRYVLFSSQDVFVRDTCIGVTGCTPSTTKVSVATDGTSGNASSFLGKISADGRYIAFNSSATNLVTGDTNGRIDVFIRDTCLGASGCIPSTTRVIFTSDGAQSNEDTFLYGLSADARYMTIRSAASNLVTGDTNGVNDIFWRDTCRGATGCTVSTARVSVAADGTQSDTDSFFAAMSADGHNVVFESDAALVPDDTNGSIDYYVVHR